MKIMKKRDEHVLIRAKNASYLARHVKDSLKTLHFLGKLWLSRKPRSLL